MASRSVRNYSQARAQLCWHCRKRKGRTSMNRATVPKAAGARGAKQPLKTGKVTRKAPGPVRPKGSEVRNKGDTRWSKPSGFLKPSLVGEKERITSAAQYKWPQLSGPLSLKEARFKSVKEKVTASAANRRRLKTVSKALSGQHKATSERKETGDQYLAPYDDKTLYDNFLRQRMELQAAEMRAKQLEQSRRFAGTRNEASRYDADQGREQWMRYHEDLAHFQALVKHMVKECMDACVKFGIQGCLPRHLDMHDNASYATIIECLLNECDIVCAKHEQELSDFYQNETRRRCRCPLPEPNSLRYTRHAYHTKQCLHAAGASRSKPRCTCNSNTSDLDCCCLE